MHLKIPATMQFVCKSHAICSSTSLLGMHQNVLDFTADSMFLIAMYIVFVLTVYAVSNIFQPGVHSCAGFKLTRTVVVNSLSICRAEQTQAGNPTTSETSGTIEISQQITTRPGPPMDQATSSGKFCFKILLSQFSVKLRGWAENVHDM